jgi:hypothetical protein
MHSRQQMRTLALPGDKQSGQRADVIAVARRRAPAGHEPNGYFWEGVAEYLLGAC